MRKKYNFNLGVGNKTMLFCSSSPVDEFYCDDIVCQHNTEQIVHVYHNPLYVLLNQKRLEQLGEMGLNDWINQFKLQKSSALDELRKQCSDADLLSTLKSRHLQSPAELLAWSRYMSSNLDKFNNEVKAVIEAQQQQDTSDVQKDTTNVQQNNIN